MDGVRSIGHLPGVLGRGILSGMKPEVVDLGFGDESKQRDRDISLLTALTGEPEDLTSEQHEAFSGMLDKLRAGLQRTLTEKQRAWAEGIAEKLKIEWEDPAEKNAKVPRGNHVEPAPVLKKLPKRPPRLRIDIGASIRLAGMLPYSREDPDFDYEK